MSIYTWRRQSVRTFELSWMKPVKLNADVMRFDGMQEVESGDIQL